MIFFKPNDKGPHIAGHPLQGGDPGGARRMTTILEDKGNMMVVLTIVSVILSIAIGLSWLSPVLQVAALFPFFAAAMKGHHHHRSLALTVRWTGVVFATTVAVGVFVPDQVGQSVLFARLSTATITNWLGATDAPPPADFRYLLWGIAVFLVATLLSGGLLGLLLTSITLGNAAVGALFFFRYGSNVIQISLVAVPLWHWGLIGAAVFMLVPASLPFFERLVKIERVAEDRRVLANFMYIGGAFLVTSMLLRLATADLWRNILREWTIF